MLQGWVALTGTPGVGKTTVAKTLAHRGVRRVDLGEFVDFYELAEGFDEERGSGIVDPKKVPKALKQVLQSGERVLLDSHWSHEVPGVKGAIVLRCRPAQLRERLLARDWSQNKIRENVEAEAIDLVLQEAVKKLGRTRVWEIDGTGRPTRDVAADVLSILEGTATADAFRPGQVDWSRDIMAGL